MLHTDWLLGLCACVYVLRQQLACYAACELMSDLSRSAVVLDSWPYVMNIQQVLTNVIPE